ncbi:MAG: glutathione S-transferase N-terminal domain-containing protein [Bdellovibrionaceae bacterium]|nr:glutathione S-transferase N-terminal domain-containing protein [Pseudobdellovibrionaceae bacterium]
MNLNLELITDKGSNSSERVEWVLNYKKISFKWTKYPDSPGEDYRKINPLLRVPSLLVDGKPVSESMAMIELLEEHRLLPSVFPKSLWERAKVREICEIVNATIHPIQSSKVAGFFIPGITKTEICPYRARWIGENLKLLEPLLFRKSQFAYGSAFSAADVFVAPIFRKGIELGLNIDNFLAYKNHLKRCYSIEEIRQACPFDLKSMIG